MARRASFPRVLMLIAVAALTGVAAASQSQTFDALDATIDEVQSAVDAGALTYERLVRIYLDFATAISSRPSMMSCARRRPRSYARGWR